MSDIESSNKTNSRPDSLSTWIEKEGLGSSKKGGRAVLWPGEVRFAQSLSEDLNYTTLVTSPGSMEILYKELENSIVFNGTSHEAADYLEEESVGVDIEYGWALADDIINGEDSSEIKGIQRIADTSHKMLNSGVWAVYNLESIGSRAEYPSEGLGVREVQNRTANKFEEYLEDQDYVEESRFFEDVGFSSSPHFAWKKK